MSTVSKPFPKQTFCCPRLRLGAISDPSGPASAIVVKYLKSTVSLFLCLSSLFAQDTMPQTPPFTGQLNSGSYNKNLYQTKEEGYPGLYYNDNNLVSGSLEALIHHLVPTVDYHPDVSVAL